MKSLRPSRDFVIESLTQDTRQGLINLLAVGVHHLFEQQLSLVVRKELFLDRESLKMSKVTPQLREAGIDLTALSGWQILKELRHVANAVKHAEGYSAEKLRKRWPSLGVPLGLEHEPFATGIKPLFLPLFGDGLYIRREDLERYFGAAENFWRSFEHKLRI